MSLDNLNTFFNFVSAVLLGVTFAVGAGAVITGHLLNKRQAERLVRMETDLTNAQRQLAEQQARAATAERDLLELKERARPRTVDPDARAAIRQFLSIGPHDTPVTIEFVSGSTSEPYSLAKQLAEILESTGWKVAALDGGPALGNPPSGLIVRISDTGGVEEQAIALQHALNRGGLECRLAKDRRVKDGQIVLLVGLKP